MKVQFTADYAHRWPSRAITAYKGGSTLTVRREVGMAAIGKGCATEVIGHASDDDDAVENDARADSLVGHDPRSPDAGSAGGIRGRDLRSGDGDHSANGRGESAGDAQ